MTYEDIEATKTPLMEHLIEFRRRLIWSALAILIAFFPHANPANRFSGGLKIDNWKDGLAIFFFAQTYFPKWFFHGITSAYTLNAEVIFYLLVPVYAWLVRRWARGP